MVEPIVACGCEVGSVMQVVCVQQMHAAGNGGATEILPTFSWEEKVGRISVAPAVSCWTPGHANDLHDRSHLAAACNDGLHHAWRAVHFS